MTRLFICICLFFISIHANAQNGGNGGWILVTASQPYVKDNTPELHATLPIPMLPLLLAATPGVLKQKGIQMGFNFDAIASQVSNMRSGDIFEKMSEGTKLAIQKTQPPGFGKAQFVILNFGTPVGVRFPLQTASRVIRFITSKLFFFKGLESQIEAVLQYAQSMPPGDYFVGTDRRSFFAVQLR